MQVLRAADYRRMAWRNGGGETAEIAVWPAGAPIDGFEWRISMATVASDAPFSPFAGVDRTLLVLDGNGIELSFGERRKHILRAGDPPFGFPADAATSARLIDGAITDLNVMSRRGCWSHSVVLLALRETGTRQAFAGPAAVFGLSGRLTLNDNGDAVELRPRDTALFAGGTVRMHAPSGVAQFVLIQFQEEAGSSNGGRDRD